MRSYREPGNRGAAIRSPGPRDPLALAMKGPRASYRMDAGNGLDNAVPQQLFLDVRIDRALLHRLLDERCPVPNPDAEIIRKIARGRVPALPSHLFDETIDRSHDRHKVTPAARTAAMLRPSFALGGILITAFKIPVLPASQLVLTCQVYFPCQPIAR